MIEPAGQERAGWPGERGRGSGAGAGRPAFVRAAGRRRARRRLPPRCSPPVKTPGKIYDPACEGAGGLSPPVGAGGGGGGCPDSRIVPSAPLRASPRRRPRPAPPPREAVGLPPPRRSARLRARPLPPAPWEAKVTACARSGSRPLPSWKPGSSVPYLSSV